jgi:Core histone H2A/H2B/H3/H4
MVVVSQLMLSRLRPEVDDDGLNRGPRRIAPVVTDSRPRTSFGSDPVATRKRPRNEELGPAIRKRKRRPGYGAIREIRRLQATTDLLIPKLAFARVVKDICGMIIPEINK